MARSFNGSTQGINTSAGALNGVPFTYGTLAVIFRWNTVPTDWMEFLSAGVSSGDFFFGIDVGSNIVGSFDGTQQAFTTFTLTANVWYCFILSKPTGTANMKLNVYDYSTMSWASHTSNVTAANPTGNLSAFYIGSYQNGFEFFNGHIAALGLFRQWDLSADANAQASGLPFSRSAWFAGTAKADRSVIWLLDQSDTSMGLRDITGGGADQTGGTAPAISTLSVPLWSYGASGLIVPSVPGVATTWLNPISDIATNSWTNDTGGTTNLYQSIDEDAPPSDSDYIRSAIGADSSSYYETELETSSDPASSTDHTVSYRYSKAGTGVVNLVASLREGSGTEIAAWTHNDISTSWATANQALSAGQANSITDYSDLRIRFAPTATATLIPTKVSDRGSTQNLTGQASTAVDLPAGASIAVGNYLIARIAIDNSGTNGAKPGGSISDPRSNTWTALDPANSNADPGAANAGSSVYIAYVKVANAYSNGDDITFNWTTGNPVAKAIVIEEWTNIHASSPVAVSAVGANGTATPANISITPSAPGQLVYVCLSTEGPTGDTAPNDTTPTNGAWTSLTRLSTTSGTAAANQTVAGQYNTTATSGVSNQWNPTITTRDWAAIAVVFAPAVSDARAQVSWAGLTIPTPAVGGNNYEDDVETTIVAVTSITDVKGMFENVQTDVAGTTTATDSRGMLENVATTGVGVTSATDALAAAESVTTTAVGVTSTTDLLAAFENVDTTIVGVTTSTDGMAFADSVATTIVALTESTDSKGLFDNVQTDVGVTTSETDVAALVDSVASTIVGVTTETDLLVATESVLTTIVGVTTETDGMAFADSVATTIVGVTSVTDEFSFNENVQTTIVSTTSIADALAAIENVQTDATAVTTATDVAAFVNNVQTDVTVATGIVEQLSLFENPMTTVAGVTSVVDQLGLFEDVQTTVVGVTTETDQAALVDSVQTDINTVTTGTDNLGNEPPPELSMTYQSGPWKYWREI